ncbi:hypothetical protein [Dactylosporangium sp. NPDC051541]|uniref:hypothetical protein n=1 Tax=Dactylosporangium sp. NPDC051541 TaxID=3363977 RepID=UPI0037B41353
MNEDSLRSLMRADDEPPESLVDLSAVVSVGRRRRQRRFAQQALAAALVLAGGLALAQPGAQPDVSAADPPTPAVTHRQQAPEQGQERGFDPVLVLRFRAGWLPEGVQPDPYPQLWAARQSQRYRSQDGTTDFTISLYAPDFPPQGHNEKQWPWAPDAYATIAGKAPGDAAANQNLWQHIAEQLDTDAQRPVPLPGYITGVTPGLALVGVEYSYDAAQQRTVWVLVLNDHAYVPGTADDPGLRVPLVPGGRAPGTVHLLDDPKDWTIDPVR